MMKFQGSIKHLLLIVVFVCALVSCNNAKEKETTTSTEATAGSASTLQSCSLLTAKDAEEVLQGPVTQGMNTNEMCQYLSASQELSKTGENVALTVHPNMATEFSKYISDTESSTGLKTESVEGVGKQAAWAEGSLIFSDGKNLYILIVGKKLDKPAHIEAARSLAKRIISRA